MDLTIPNLALLINAENTEAEVLPQLLVELAKYGSLCIKRIYGNWTSNQLGAWKSPLLQYSIQPIQQLTYTTGKNATDSALIIDAMDLLYNHSYLNGFCIVSSDSDFTRLASRLRESGKYVLGVGKQNTPEAFKASCNHFIYTEMLKPTTELIPIKQPQNTNNKSNTKINISENKKLIKLTLAAFNNISDEHGKASLSTMRSQLSKILNDFDPKNYGFTKFSDFIEATKLFNFSHKNTIIQLKEDKQSKVLKIIEEELLIAFKNSTKIENTAYLSTIKANTNFKHEDYGYKNFSSLLKATGLFDIINRDTQAKLRKTN